MKKKSLVCLLLLILASLFLCGCGKSEEACKADELILDIGPVSVDSKDAIEKAEFYYSMLDEKDKEKVEHYDYLLQARDEYNALEALAKSEEAIKADELILDIGVVSIDSKSAIEKAEFYFSMLSEQQKNQVEHYDYLLQAREEFDILAEEANKVLIPSVAAMTKDAATEKLTKLGLSVEYKEIYTEREEKGLAVYTNPTAGKSVDKGQTVTVAISKGPRTIYAKSSYMNWTYIGYGRDDWEFNQPYIEEDSLYINCHNVTFGSNIEWRDRYSEGHASGTASVNDRFDKVVPAKIHYKDQSVPAYTPQSFLVEVPLSDLSVERPTDMYFRIGIKTGGVEKNLEFNIAMTW